MESRELAEFLVSLGCPQEKSLEMASQLSKRATQLMEVRKVSYEEALLHLLKLMKQASAS